MMMHGPDPSDGMRAEGMSREVGRLRWRRMEGERDRAHKQSEERIKSRGMHTHRRREAYQ